MLFAGLWSGAQRGMAIPDFAGFIIGQRCAPTRRLHPGCKSAFFASDLDTLLPAARLKQ
jgi:hypothetical protein